MADSPIAPSERAEPAESAGAAAPSARENSDLPGQIGAGEPELRERDSLSPVRLAAFAGRLLGLSTRFFFVLFCYLNFATDVLGIAAVIFIEDSSAGRV